MSISKSLHGASIALEFKLDPPVSEWTLVAGAAAGAPARYTSGGYTLDLEEQLLDGGHTLVGFTLRRDSGEPFVVQEYLLKTDVSLAGVEQVWMPHPGAKAAIVNASCNVTMADRGIPMIIAMTRTGTAKLAIGLVDQRIETELAHEAATDSATLRPTGNRRLSLRRPIDDYSIGPVAEHRDAFFVSSGHSWFDTMQALSRIHDKWTGKQLRPSPDPAWEPHWVPWGTKAGMWERGFYHWLTSEELLGAARAAADLGMRGMINWDGWYVDYDPAVANKPNTWGSPYTGDYAPLPHKFPDFAAFVRQLKALGIRCSPWISPWLAAPRSKTREQLKEAMIELHPSTPGYQGGTTTYLCPRNPLTQKHVPELIARLLREYELDGFCMDMVDRMPMQPCIAKHEHNYSSIGLAVADTMERMRAAIDAVNPNAVIEFRIAYANISNLGVATTFRAPDTGHVCSYDADREWCLRLRSFVPAGLAVHFDPAWWHRYEDIQTIAKMLSTMVISGVPQIGNDVLNMPEDQRRLVKTWLSFYHEHKEDLRYGQMRPVQNDPQYSTIKVERGAKAFVLFSRFPALNVPLSTEAAEIYLLNCTNDDALYAILENVPGEFTATAQDHFLRPVGEKRLSAEARGLLVDLPVPQGGCIALRRVV